MCIRNYKGGKSILYSIKLAIDKAHNPIDIQQYPIHSATAAPPRSTPQYSHANSIPVRWYIVSATDKEVPSERLLTSSTSLIMNLPFKMSSNLRTVTFQRHKFSSFTGQVGNVTGPAWFMNKRQVDVVHSEVACIVTSTQKYTTITSVSWSLSRYLYLHKLRDNISHTKVKSTQRN